MFVHIDSNLRHCKTTSKPCSRLSVQKEYHKHTSFTQKFKELKRLSSLQSEEGHVIDVRIIAKDIDSPKILDQMTDARATCFCTQVELLLQCMKDDPTACRTRKSQLDDRKYADSTQQARSDFTLLMLWFIHKHNIQMN
jgi:hypothetical protein